MHRALRACLVTLFCQHGDMFVTEKLSKVQGFFETPLLKFVTFNHHAVAPLLFSRVRDGAQSINPPIILDLSGWQSLT